MFYKIFKRAYLGVIFLFCLTIISMGLAYGKSLIIDHNCVDISKIPTEWINRVKDEIKLQFGHMSHGKQITVGLTRLEELDSKYSVALSVYTSDSTVSTLPIDPGALCISDLYRTINYWAKVPEDLANNLNVNTSMFVWCSEFDDHTGEWVTERINEWAQLELDYPEITFIYTTNNVQRTGYEGYIRQLRNDEIRSHCSTNNRILFDFAGLDSWWFNPSTNKWEKATYQYFDDSEYVSVETEHPQFYGEEAGHTTYESCEQKAKALWWLLARLVGWNPIILPPQPPRNLRIISHTN